MFQAEGWHNQIWILEISDWVDFGKWILVTNLFFLTLTKTAKRNTKRRQIHYFNQREIWWTEASGHLNIFGGHLSRCGGWNSALSRNSCSYSSGYNFGSTNETNLHDICTVNVMWSCFYCVFCFCLQRSSEGCLVFYGGISREIDVWYLDP